MRDQTPPYPPVDPAPYRPSGEQLPLGSFPSGWEMENPPRQTDPDPDVTPAAEQADNNRSYRRNLHPTDLEHSDLPAGFWRRAVAFVTDLLLVQLMAAILGSMSTMGVLQSAAGTDLSPQASQEMAVMFAAQTVPLLLLCYFLFFTAYGGRTPGKMLMSLRVHTLTEQPLSWTRALGRTLCYLASVLTWGIGFLVAAGPAKRALHDHLSGTQVRYRRRA